METPPTGVGKALVCLYLAYKLCFVKGDNAISARHLEDVEDLAMGHEDAERVAEVVAESSPKWLPKSSPSRRA